MITGKGKAHIGDNVTFGCPKAFGFYSDYILIDSRCEDGEVKINSNVIVGNSSVISSFSAGIIIGENCFLGLRTTILDSDFHPVEPTKRRGKPSSKKVILGKNGTTGIYSIILKGVQIGDGCFVGAGTVVKKSSPSNQRITGNPATSYSIKPYI